MTVEVEVGTSRAKGLFAPSSHVTSAFRHRTSRFVHADPKAAQMVKMNAPQKGANIRERLG